MKRENYNSLEGIKALAAIGIVLMHIRANANYQIEGFIYNKIIASFTNFTFLFMAISAFGLCCGYYEKYVNNTIKWSDFYKRRFGKIIPFFGLLVLIDLILSPSKEALYEALADITLMFGFLDKAGNISVIGVGWFLGLIFVFYLIFPFFCFILEEKKRIILAVIVSLFYQVVVADYFGIGRTNILYSSAFFLIGGIIFIYRKKIQSINTYLRLILVVLSIFEYYLIPNNPFNNIIVSAIILMYAIGTKNVLLNNKAMLFISNISLEVYLSHMLVFRVLEKIKITYIFGKGITSYIVTAILVLVGASMVGVIFKKSYLFIETKIKDENKK